jgi:hypothetical protein
MPTNTIHFAYKGWAAALLVLASGVLAMGSAAAAPDGQPRHSPDGPPSERGARGPGADGRPQHQAGYRIDNAHGHGHSYPVYGHVVRALPPQSRVVVWSGVNYGFYNGVWYAPGQRGHVVVQPPYGIWVSDLPLFRTVVVIGGLTYLYANGAYYRERSLGGYEVVAPPQTLGDVVPSAGPAVAVTAAARVFIYPRMGQSAEQQASDEYECHRWAVSQSSFDPTIAATGSAGADTSRRGDYQRARVACLEGRNYTVR